MKPADRTAADYLRDIRDAVTKALTFVEGMDLSAFRKDERTQFAVVRALEVVGEATKKIPSRVRKQYPALPWPRMAGMRDKLIHDYFGVSVDVVWQTVQEDLPLLKTAIEQVLKDLGE